MPARNMLLLAPPHPGELALKELGANLRTARLRRTLTIEEVAQKIGVGRRQNAEARWILPDERDGFISAPLTRDHVLPAIWGAEVVEA